MAGACAQPRGIRRHPPEEEGKVIPGEGNETSKGTPRKGRARGASGRLSEWPVWREAGRLEQEVGPGGKSLEYDSKGRFSRRWGE